MYATVCTIDSRVQKCWEALIITPWPPLTGVAPKCRTTPASPLGRSKVLKQPRKHLQVPKVTIRYASNMSVSLARGPHTPNVNRPPSSRETRTRQNDGAMIDDRCGPALCGGFIYL